MREVWGVEGGGRRRKTALCVLAERRVGVAAATDCVILKAAPTEGAIIALAPTEEHVVVLETAATATPLAVVVVTSEGEGVWRRRHPRGVGRHGR